MHFEKRLPSLTSGENLIITKKVVSDYINGMQPKEMFYFINKVD